MLIKKIVGAEVEKVIAGGGNGSIVLFDLIKTRNKFVLFVYCAWRLSDGKEVLTGWNDDPTNKNSAFTKFLNLLTNDIIEEIRINDFGDLSISFASGKVFQVFCDITSNGKKDELEDNWSICDLELNECENYSNYFSIRKEAYS